MKEYHAHMGHTHVDIAAVGSKGRYCLKSIMIDTGATYTILPTDVLEAIGAFKLPVKVPLELGNGEVIEADTYASVIEIEDRKGPIVAVTFAGAKPVVGVQALESLGLKVNPITTELEPTRPKGIAYFY